MYDSENLKVADYLDRWLDAIRDTLRERTWRRHEEITRLHLKPTIGSARLDKLNALKVQTLYRSKLSLEEARGELAKQAKETPEIQPLVDFLAISTRGIVR